MQNLEIELAHCLMLIADGERKVDINRQVLCEQEGFEPYACFRLLDKERKGYVNVTNIMNFLKY